MNRSHEWLPKVGECASCNRFRTQIRALHARERHLNRSLQRSQSLVARLRQELLESRRQGVGNRLPVATASNSSLPPSANPIGARRPVVKKPTGRKRGAQVGHRGTRKSLLPVEKMDQVVHHRPAVCGHCQASIDAQCVGELVGRHQVAELPVVAVTLTEHQSFACRCGRCGKVTRGLIPQEIAVSATGPRLTAAIGILGAWVKGSRRAVAEVVSEMLGCPISLGSIGAREAELSLALAGPYEQLAHRVAAAPVKYVDETGWKLNGKPRWLFVAATRRDVVFRIEKGRTYPSLLKLLEGKTQGVICSDRFGIYDLWPKDRRGLCWAHLKRDFTAAMERGGEAEAIGREALEITAKIFALWRGFKHRRLTRRGLRRGIAPLRRQMHQVLLAGTDCVDKKTRGLCRALLKRKKGLWRFVTTPGLDPTNNLAERMLRPAVIWRKKSFGSQSQNGCIYVQRMLSVIQTLRLRGMDVIDYLSAAVAAHRRGEPPPAPGAMRNASTKDPDEPNLLRIAKQQTDMRKIA